MRALASMVVAALLLLGSSRAIAQEGSGSVGSAEAEDSPRQDATLPPAPSREREGEGSTEGLEEGSTEGLEEGSTGGLEEGSMEGSTEGSAAGSTEAEGSPAGSAGSTAAEGSPRQGATLPPAPSREREGEGSSAIARGRLADGSLDPCATDLRSRPIGPLSVGELDGQLGVPYRACPRNEVAIGGDALLVADTANFYGNIRASGRVRLSMLLDDNVEGFLSWEALRYQTVISSISAAYLGLGYLSYGATARLHSAGGRVYSITGRMVLPTTSGLDQSSQPLALDIGVTGAWQVDANFRFHMWLVLLGSVAIGAGPADPRAGVRVGGGVDWRPYEWISFVAELNGGFGYRDALDLLAAQVGVRFALGTEVGLELGGSLPFLGVRALDSGALPIAATLMLNWRLR